MKTLYRLALVLAAVVVHGGPARAQNGDLCASLKRAWAAGKSDPESLRGLRLAGAHACSFSDADLRCTWVTADVAEARHTFEEFQTIATPCMAPLGLVPFHVDHNGVDTLSLRAAGADPNVAIFFPGSTTVTIVVITAR